jgi:NAD(P)-dependent dehydrogenase (short-subunit alcohol dehydrogenase family)
LIRNPGLVDQNWIFDDREKRGRGLYRNRDNANRQYSSGRVGFGQAISPPGQLDALHPVGHMSDISDIVEAILYLESASFVTVEILHVDGGQSAGY